MSRVRRKPTHKPPIPQGKLVLYSQICNELAKRFPEQTMERVVMALDLFCPSSLRSILEALQKRSEGTFEPFYRYLAGHSADGTAIELDQHVLEGCRWHVEETCLVDDSEDDLGFNARYMDDDDRRQEHALRTIIAAAEPYHDQSRQVLIKEAVRKSETLVPALAVHSSD